jgi:hypothetical protein
MLSRTLARFVLPAYLTLAIGLNAYAEELRCVYAVEETVWESLSTRKGYESGKAASHRVDKSYSMPLGLGKDYFFVVKGDKQVVFDYRARKIFRLNLRNHTYEDSFLDAFVAYYVQELTYRMARAEGLKAAKTSDAELDQEFEQFNLESVFSRRLPKDVGRPGTPTAEILASDKGWIASYKGKIVVDFTPSEYAVPSFCGQSFLHFLIHGCKLHPQLWHKVAESERFPETLVYRYYRFGPSSCTFHLKSVAENLEEWKGIPAGFTKEVRADDPLAPVVKLFKRAREEAKPPTKEDVKRYVQKALDGDDVLDAYLAWHEWFLQTGEYDEDLGRPILQAADREIRTLHSVIGKEEKESERRMLDIVRALEKRSPTKKYVLAVILANLLVDGSRFKEALDLQQKALEANPYLAAVYFDIGHVFYLNFNMDSAWRCAEMTRALAIHHPLLRNFEKLESQLQKDFPEDFASSK